MHQSWKQYIRPTTDLGLKSASNQHVYIEGAIKLVVLLGDLYVYLSFGVLDDLVLKIILGTSYIDRFITELIPLERRIVQFHFWPVAIGA